MYNHAMPNQCNDDDENGVHCNLPQLLVVQGGTPFELSLFMHRLWLDATERTAEKRNHGCVKWSGTPPELSLPGEDGMA